MVHPEMFIWPFTYISNTTILEQNLMITHIENIYLAACILFISASSDLILKICGPPSMVSILALYWSVFKSK